MEQHTQYIIPILITVVMDDGSEEEFDPGGTTVVSPGHNAWVVSDEPMVGIDFIGLKLCKGIRATNAGLTEVGEEKYPKKTRKINYQTILLIYFQLIWIHGITMPLYVVLRY
jgi:hypothetical protein